MKSFTEEFPWPHCGSSTLERFRPQPQAVYLGSLQDIHDAARVSQSYGVRSRTGILRWVDRIGSGTPIYPGRFDVAAQQQIATVLSRCLRYHGCCQEHHSLGLRRLQPEEIEHSSMPTISSGTSGARWPGNGTVFAV